ncbi:MAG: DUF2325 domain-containing protein [Thiobacillaceae bacterium]|jgi:multidrug efflux pump subunit AcrA (membrane-fusion protein)|nr:DUF2325 domain-containing protein [Thiobacillaceae bacterium]
MCDRHSLDGAIRNLFSPAQPAEDAGARPAPVARLEPVRPGRRRKLWELEEKHHCPVVGSCLSLEEIKKIARKSGSQGHGFDAYRLHVEAVSVSCSRNAAAEAMQRTLERKFAHVVRRFDQARTDAEVLEMWREHLDRGEVAGALWATLTHRSSSPETRQAVHADMHMLSHQVGAGQAADLRRLGFLEEECARLRARERQSAERQAREIAESAARLRSLREEHDRLRAAAEAAETLRERIHALESGQAMVAMGRRLLLLEATNAELREAARRSLDLERRTAALAAENARLRGERDAMAAERDALEKLWAASPAPSSECGGDCASCPDRLRGRCVLCVGGRVPLLSHYRQLPERLGMRLIHHDGGREESLSRLPDLLAASDAVICPTDCVSHAAYHQLKRHCKTAGKPCVLARSSGIAGFAAALARLALGRADIRPQVAGET